jgi:hypothetical protein
LFRFDRNYIELGLGSIGLGILNWSLLNLYTGKTLNTLLLKPSITEYVQISIVSIVVGLAIASAIMVAKKIIQKIQESKGIKEYNKKLRKVGYAEDKESTWYTFIKAHHEAGRRFGDYYGIRVRVFIKDPILLFGNQTPTEGIIEHFDKEPPYSISLSAKYVTSCKKNELINQLFEDSHFLRSRFKNNNKVRQQVLKHLNLTNLDEKDPQLAIENILAKLRENLDNIRP